MKSVLSTLSEPPVITSLSLASLAGLLNLVSVFLGIIGAAVAIGYTVYRWRRDYRGRTCDRTDCPRRFQQS